MTVLKTRAKLKTDIPALQKDKPFIQPGKFIARQGQKIKILIPMGDILLAENKKGERFLVTKYDLE